MAHVDSPDSESEEEPRGEGGRAGSLNACAASRWWRPTTTFFLIIWIVLLAFGRAKMLRDPGTLWHTVVGEQILQTGELVRTDSFSFTCHGRPWIAQQWLGECAMALVHRLAGLDGLMLAAVTLLAATYTTLASRFIRTGLSWPAATLLVVLVIASSSYHFLPRPHLVTIALTAWTFGQLCDIEAGRCSPRRLFLLPIVFVVWSNIHGGVLAGIVTTLLVLIAWLLWPTSREPPSEPACPQAGPHEPSGKPGAHVASSATITIVAVLSVLAVLVNPYGLALPRIWFSLTHSKVLPKLIIEHAPLQLLSLEGLMIGALAVVYIAILIATWRSARPVNPGSAVTPVENLSQNLLWHGPLARDETPARRRCHNVGIGSKWYPPRSAVHIRVTWLIPLLWLVAALMRVRHGPLFAVTAAVAIADMLPYLKRYQPSAIRDQHGHWRAAVIPAALIFLALVLQATSLPCPVIGAGWSRLEPDYWPVEAAKALRNHIFGTAMTSNIPESTTIDEQPANAQPSESRKPKAESHVFNHMRFGGYLIYKVPEVRIYIDDRCELYGDEFLMRYTEIQKDPQRIEGIAAEYDITMALVKAGSPLDKYLADAPTWTRLHHDATASLYVRAGP